MLRKLSQKPKYCKINDMKGLQRAQEVMKGITGVKETNKKNYCMKGKCIYGTTSQSTIHQNCTFQ